MLEPVESPADCIVLRSFVRIGVETQIRYERIPRLHVIHHH
jgi:hypothetical protein